MKFGDPGNVRTAATAASVGGPTRRLEGGFGVRVETNRGEARIDGGRAARGLALRGLREEDPARGLRLRFRDLDEDTFAEGRDLWSREARSGERGSSALDSSIGANNSRRGFLHRRVIRRRARRDATRRGAMATSTSTDAATSEILSIRARTFLYSPGISNPAAARTATPRRDAPERFATEAAAALRATEESAKDAMATRSVCDCLR